MKKLTEKDFEKMMNDIIQAFQVCYGLIGGEMVNRKRQTKFNKEIKIYSPIGELKS